MVLDIFRCDVYNFYAGNIELALKNVGLAEIYETYTIFPVAVTVPHLKSYPKLIVKLSHARPALTSTICAFLVVSLAALDTVHHGMFSQTMLVKLTFML